MFEAKSLKKKSELFLSNPGIPASSKPKRMLIVLCGRKTAVIIYIGAPPFSVRFPARNVLTA